MSWEKPLRTTSNITSRTISLLRQGSRLAASALADSNRNGSSIFIPPKQHIASFCRGSFVPGMPTNVSLRYAFNHAARSTREWGKVSRFPAPALAQSHRNHFRRGSFLALSQKGEWHFAHTFGLSGLRGHQRCPHRLQRCSSRCGFMDKSILLSSGFVK
jgi:hypothetical protein